MNFLERVLRNVLQKEIEDILRTLSIFKLGRNLETTDGQRLFVSFGEQRLAQFTSVDSVASRKNIFKKAVPVPTFLTYLNIPPQLLARMLVPIARFKGPNAKNLPAFG